MIQTIWQGGLTRDCEEQVVIGFWCTDYKVGFRLHSELRRQARRHWHGASHYIASELWEGSRTCYEQVVARVLRGETVSVATSWDWRLRFEYERRGSQIRSWRLRHDELWLETCIRELSPWRFVIKGRRLGKPSPQQVCDWRPHQTRWPPPR